MLPVLKIRAYSPSSPFQIAISRNAEIEIELFEQDYLSVKVFFIHTLRTPSTFFLSRIERFSSQILWGRLIRNNEPPLKEGLGDLIPVLSKMIELQCRMGNQGPTQRRKHIPKPRVTPQWNGSWIGIYFKARRRRECFSNPMYKRMIDLSPGQCIRCPKFNDEGTYFLSGQLRKN